MDAALAVAQGDDLSSQSETLLRGMEGDIAGTTDYNRLAVDAIILGGQHFGHEIGGPVARSLWPDERTTPSGLLSGQDAGKLIAKALVLTEHVADLSSAHTDVSCGYVGVWTDVTRQLRHETLAEAHYLGIALAFGIEIRAAFSATHGQRRQAVLEDLFETEELQNAEVHTGVKAKASLVGTNGGVEFHAVTAIDLNGPRIVRPRHAEGNDPFWLDHAFEQGMALILRVLLNERNDGLCDLFNGLQEFWLVGVSAMGFSHKRLDTGVLHGTVK